MKKIFLFIFLSHTLLSNVSNVRSANGSSPPQVDITYNDNDNWTKYYYPAHIIMSDGTIHLNGGYKKRQYYTTTYLWLGGGNYTTVNSTDDDDNDGISNIDEVNNSQNPLVAQYLPGQDNDSDGLLNENDPVPNIFNNPLGHAYYFVNENGEVQTTSPISDLSLTSPEDENISVHFDFNDDGLIDNGELFEYNVSSQTVGNPLTIYVAPVDPPSDDNGDGNNNNPNPNPVNPPSTDSLSEGSSSNTGGSSGGSNTTPSAPNNTSSPVSASPDDELWHENQNTELNNITNNLQKLVKKNEDVNTELDNISNNTNVLSGQLEDLNKEADNTTNNTNAINENVITTNQKLDELISQGQQGITINNSGIENRIDTTNEKLDQILESSEYSDTNLSSSFDDLKNKQVVNSDSFDFINVDINDNHNAIDLMDYLSWLPPEATPQLSGGTALIETSDFTEEKSFIRSVLLIIMTFVFAKQTFSMLLNFNNSDEC